MLYRYIACTGNLITVPPFQPLSTSTRNIVSNGWHADERDMVGSRQELKGQSRRYNRMFMMAFGSFKRYREVV